MDDLKFQIKFWGALFIIACILYFYHESPVEPAREFNQPECHHVWDVYKEKCRAICEDEWIDLPFGKDQCEELDRERPEE